MNNRFVMTLGVISGILLVAVSILFPLAVPLENRSLAATVKLLAERETISFSYTIAVVASNVLFAPLLILLTIRL